MTTSIEGSRPTDPPRPASDRRRDGSRCAGAVTAEAAAAGPPSSSRRLNQSVCRWCYGKISLDDLCSAAKRMGLVGIDLLGPNDFPTLKKYGLICTMTARIR